MVSKSGGKGYLVCEKVTVPPTLVVSDVKPYGLVVFRNLNVLGRELKKALSGPFDIFCVEGRERKKEKAKEKEEFQFFFKIFDFSNTANMIFTL